jgi:hypothetical protein
MGRVLFALPRLLLTLLARPELVTRSRVIAALLVIALVFSRASSPALAVTWIQNFSDNFTRANTYSPMNNWANRAQSPQWAYGGTPSNIQTPQPTLYTISGNKLKENIPNPSSTQMFNTQLTRPQQESPDLNQRVVVTTEAIADANPATRYGAVVRVQLVGDDYVCFFATASTNNFSCGTSVGYTYTSKAAATVTVNSGDSYSIDLSATGSSPTTITGVLTDVSTSTVVSTISGTDSTAEFQSSTSPGLVGLESANGSGTQRNPEFFTNFVDYSDVTAAADPPYYDIAFIGDSISNGANDIGGGSDQYSPPIDECNIIQATIYPQNVYCINYGVNGAAYSNFKPGGSYNAASLALFQAAMPGLPNEQDYLSEALGTNEANVSTSAATWQANAIATNASYTGGIPGLQVMLNLSPYANCVVTLGVFGCQIPSFLVQYAAVAPNVVAAQPSQVFMGANPFTAFSGADSTYWMYSSSNTLAGVHPTTMGSWTLGSQWALAFLNHIGAVGGYYFLY